MRPVAPIEELDRNIVSLCTRINCCTFPGCNNRRYLH